MSEKTTTSDEANKGEKCESEQDARIALLGHFSSKSTNEVIILLTEAFAFFTFLGLILPIIVVYRDYFVIVASGFFACLISYAFGKLVFYGEQAQAILCVEMSKMGEMPKKIEEYKARQLPKPIKSSDGKKYPLDLQPTCLQRLSFACGSYLEARYQKSRLIKVANFLQRRQWVFLVFTFTVVALFIRYYFR
jgi:hypothetical protein